MIWRSKEASVDLLRFIAPRIYAVVCCVVAASWMAGCREGAGDSRNCINISAENAAAIAEEYVRDNGHTRAPGNPNRVFLQKGEENIDLSTILERRHGVLEGSAIGYKSIDGGWRISFRYSQPITFGDKVFARTVVVDHCLGSAYMEHESPELNLGELELLKP